jgi:hypothetical protein
MRRLLAPRSTVNSTLVRSLTTKQTILPTRVSSLASLQTLPLGRFKANSFADRKNSQEVWSEFNTRYFSTSKPETKKQEEESEEDSSKTVAVEATKGKVRQLWEKYGIVFLGFYGGLYLVTLGSIYEVVALKHVDPHGVVAYLHSIGVDNYVDVSPIASSKAGNFALAWILTKFTEPLRLAFTVTITPSLARFLGYAPPKKVKEAVKPMATTTSLGKKSEGASA